MATTFEREGPTVAGGPAGAGLLARSARGVGRALSAVPALLLSFSAALKLTQRPAVLPFFQGRLGYSEREIVAIGILEAACAILYAIPRTAFLGALLVTGYLGGAVASYVRIGKGVAAPLAVGVLVWAGLWLRDARLRALLPLRRNLGSPR